MFYNERSYDKKKKPNRDAGNVSSFKSPWKELKITNSKKP